MVLNRFTKGPQIHFWISDKVVSSSKPPQTNSEVGEPLQSPGASPQDDRRKDRSLPPYYHVEIF